MAAIKAWAKSLFVLAVFSSTVLLITPKSALKQARFVAEMLLLLCVIAPLAGLLGSTGTAVGAMPSLPGAEGAERFSLEEFYAGEIARRVIEIGSRAGIPVESVKVTTKDAGFSLAEVEVYLSDLPGDEAVATFKDTLGAYLGIQKDKVKVVLP